MTASGFCAAREVISLAGPGPSTHEAVRVSNPVIMSTSDRDASWTLRRHAYCLQSSEGPIHNYGPPGKKGIYAMTAETIRPILATEGQDLLQRRGESAPMADHLPSPMLASNVLSPTRRTVLAGIAAGGASAALKAAPAVARAADLPTTIAEAGTRF